MGENLTIEDLFKLNEKYLNDEKFSVDGIDNDNFEDYYFDRCCEFFDADYEQVKKLVGKCYIDPSGTRLVKILAVRDDTDNQYWDSCKLWQEFIYEEVRRNNKKSPWYFEDWLWLQHEDELKKFQLTSHAEMNIASESMFHIGKDGCLYVDYGCDGNYDKFVEVKPAKFKKAREVAIKEFEEEFEEE